MIIFHQLWLPNPTDNCCTSHLDGPLLLHVSSFFSQYLFPAFKLFTVNVFVPEPQRNGSDTPRSGHCRKGAIHHQSALTKPAVPPTERERNKPAYKLFLVLWVWAIALNLLTFLGHAMGLFRIYIEVS